VKLKSAARLKKSAYAVRLKSAAKPKKNASAAKPKKKNVNAKKSSKRNSLSPGERQPEREGTASCLSLFLGRRHF
jgi:hypothetical protein